ncbi:MAG: arsenite methyltransferase [Gammaproteobacteria bacterium]|jgi:SAM-dependent methyltransferase|nr:arsenite methyltransferase [Gammaproteobacteria bacterium]
MKESASQLREMVRKKYAEVAQKPQSGCCTPCCESDAQPEDGFSMIGDAYDGASGYLADADLGLGCGVPVEHAGLQPGQTVLDLGSGAGLDAFIARQEVGDSGHVIGVDMTAEMVAKARDNAVKSHLDNVEFRLGEIEFLPILSDSIDVVISNCVLNLVPDKQRAFAEIFRVLKPGGRFCISDVVSSRELPDWVKGIAEAYAGCVSGTIPKGDYLKLIEDAGFGSVEVASERRIDIPAELIGKSLTRQQREEARDSDLHVVSITVTATKEPRHN